MRRYRRFMYDNDLYDENNPGDRYGMAYRQMKRIKKFYVHLIVYIVVNGFLIGDDYFDNTPKHDLWSWGTWNVAVLWGIGLIIHGLSVFGRDIFFSAEWERNKIQKFMDKDKNQKWE